MVIKMFAHTTDMQTARMPRGQSMIEHGFEPIQLETNMYQMPSQSGNGVYTIANKYNAWFCDCPDFTYRHVECKHIHAIRFWQTLKAKLAQNSRRKLRNCRLKSKRTRAMIILYVSIVARTISRNTAHERPK